MGTSHHISVSYRSPEVEVKPLPRVEDGTRDTSRTNNKRNLGLELAPYAAWLSTTREYTTADCVPALSLLALLSRHRCI